MMRVVLEFSRNIIFDRPFHRIDILAGADTRPVADPENMRVHGLRGLTEPHVQDHIRRLAPHTRQRLQRRPRGGHLAAILFHKDLAQLDDILGLVAIQTNRPDRLGYLLQPEVQHLLRRIGDGK